MFGAYPSPSLGLRVWQDREMEGARHPESAARLPSIYHPLGRGQEWKQTFFVFNRGDLGECFVSAASINYLDDSNTAVEEMIKIRLLQ